jgi:hypothetical protein
MDIGTVTLDYNPDVEAIKDALTATDDIGVVIRCHFQAERAIVHLLDSLTTGRFSKKADRYRYLSNKLDLLEVLGFQPDWVAPLRVVNAHRNHFAHQGQDTLKETDERELKEAVSRVFGVVANPELKMRLPIFEGDRFYADCDLRTRYVMMTVMATTAALTYPHAAKKAASTV